MKAQVAIAAIFAALAGSAAAQLQRAPLDVKACLRDARLAIEKLQPAAERVLGQAIDVAPPTMVDIYASAAGLGDRRDESLKYAARVDGKQIRITATFCRTAAGSRLAIIAHELGHVLDTAAGTTPVAGSPNWNADPREISATRRGREILSAAGIGNLDLIAAMPAEHLAHAGILHPVPLSAIAQTVAGNRKVSLYRFDGKPGEWSAGLGEHLEIRYSPTNAAFDEFFAVYFITRHRDATQRHDFIASIEAAAKAYRAAGGDLAALAVALDPKTAPRAESPTSASGRDGDAPSNRGISDAIRRVLAQPAGGSGQAGRDRAPRRRRPAA